MSSVVLAMLVGVEIGWWRCSRTQYKVLPNETEDVQWGRLFWVLCDSLITLNVKDFVVKCFEVWGLCWLVDFVDGWIDWLISKRIQLLNASSPTLHVVVTRDVCIIYRVCAYVFVLLQWLVWYGDVAGTQDKDLLWGLTKSVVRIAFNLWMLDSLESQVRGLVKDLWWNEILWSLRSCWLFDCGWMDWLIDFLEDTAS